MDQAKLKDLRERVLAGGPTNAWRLSECLALLDTLDACETERDRLRAQIAPLQSVTQGVEVPDLPSAVWADAKTEDSRDQCISVVRDWYRDWIAANHRPDADEAERIRMAGYASIGAQYE